MFWEVARLLNYCVEWKVILNDITQDNNKVMGYKINETVKFHGLDRSIEESLSTFKSVVEIEQQNVEYQQKRPLAENENPPGGQTRNMRRRKPSSHVKELKARPYP